MMPDALMAPPAASTLAAALGWAARGFRVFPLVENDKVPLWEGWQTAATSDAPTIQSWFIDPVSGWSRPLNYGVVGDGLVIVDLDVKDGRDGIAHYLDLGLDFDTLTVRTPSNGYHLYFAGPPTANTVGKIAAGIDTRGPQGYVVGPGSIVDGRPYTVEIDQSVVPVPPQILQRLEAPRERGAGPALTADLDTPAAMAAAVYYLGLAAPAVEGMGGDTHTYHVCCEVRDRGISEGLALQLLLEHWNERCSPPWDGEALKAKVENAFLYGQNSAGQKSPEVYFGGVSVPLPEYITPVPSVSLGADRFSFGNLLPLSTLQPRPWVYHRMLLRRETTVLIAPGGAGKSQFILTLACHMALGLDFFGYKNVAGRPMRSVIYNAEDSEEEMAMRVYATCTQYEFDVERVRPMLSLVSGKGGTALRLVKGGRIHDEHVAQLLKAAQQPDVGMIGLDPLVKLHDVNENDNQAMSYVMDTIELVGAMSNTAVLLAHHTSKPGMGGSSGYAGNADASRGAAAIKDSARVAFTLMGPDDRDCETYGITPKERRSYLRLDDAKMNRGLMDSEPTWIHKAGVTLWTGEEIGVFEPADMAAKGEFVVNEVARILIEELTNRGAGSMTMPEAAGALGIANAAYNRLGTNALKQRIDRYIGLGGVTIDNQKVRVEMKGSAKLIVLD